ncbi:MAG: serine--tRNA ligase [Candidatus Neomarinimicrobiota bacterium]|jgi:seryl-tRNA synthetase|nr:serine--tRNA ligase [Candidatus Neomarinimicrobiota bacterium]MDD3966008.1 serine--tRNA ligase [Candidatus Neomarinimicrobiota bacterium]MDX9780200.1 serine--tRNA ligase [bacterium]
MIDIKVLREDPSAAEERLALKNVRIDVNAILVLDERRRSMGKDVDDMKCRRNKVSEGISLKKRNQEDASAEIADMQELSAAIREKDAALAEIQKELQRQLLAVPNMPSPETPPGKSEADNVVVRSQGKLRDFDFEPKDHLDIAEILKMLDMKRGAKIAGSGFPLYTGTGARLERALINFMLDLHGSEHGYSEIFPPFLVHSGSATGTGQLPKMAEDMYYLREDDLWLIPTAEVPVTNIHRDEVLSAAELPIRYVAYSGCFRREAGSYGKETRGLQRLHQFNKVEMVQFVHPDRSYEAWEQLIGNAESVLQKLGLPYRVVELCSADLSFAAARCCDIELWAPGSKKWLEVSSCSNFEDFQARRANIRFKDENGMRFVHTLNGSGVATPRLMIALIENYQQADGSLRIPEALQPYLGTDHIKG